MQGSKPGYDCRQIMDGLDLLTALPDGCAKLVCFDPQYRAVLDVLSFGNEGVKRQRSRSALSQMSDAQIGEWLEQIDRVLKPAGHVALWIDKFALGSGRHLSMLDNAPRCQVVDILIWDKCRFGMGSRSRGRYEAVVIAQRHPIRASGVWTDRAFPDCWPESSDRSEHPHAKPRQFTERLIRAITKRGDLVVDPCAGSYVVLDACQATGRRFCGCDLV